jgi:hypothetical protein
MLTPILINQLPLYHIATTKSSVFGDAPHNIRYYRVFIGELDKNPGENLGKGSERSLNNFVVNSAYVKRSDNARRAEV